MGLRGGRNFSQFWPIVAGPIVAALIPVAATAQSAPVVRQASTPVADYHAHISSLEVSKGSTLPLMPGIELPPDLAAMIKLREDYEDPAVGAQAFRTDGLLLDTRFPNWVRGREAVRLWLSLTTKGLKYRPIEARIGADFGYIAGYVVFPWEGDWFVARNFHMSLEKSDGKWQIAAESWENRVPPLQEAQTAEEYIEELDEAGIEHGVILSSAFVFGGSPSDEGYAKVKAENDWTVEQVGLYPDRLVAFCGINPLQPYGVKEVERCATLRGVKGIKMHFHNDGVDLRKPDHVASVRRVFEAANANGLHIVAHISNGDGLYDKAVAAEQTKAFIEDVLPGATKVTVQIAHMGGDTGWGSDNDATFEHFATAIRDDARGTQNLYFDLSGAVTDRSSDEALMMIATRMRQVGIDRFLFGSDRSGTRNPPPKDALNAVRRLPLSPEEFEDLADNRMPYLP